MCGIAGILRVHPAGGAVPPPDEAIPEAWLDILDESIKHRGPDGQGRFRDRAVRADGAVVDVALVHRRLSIIDIAGGAQPMVSVRGRNADEGLVAVVFNGCIYNHRALRKELQAAGHRFETDHSDTEVLVHGWREWRDSLFGRLDGMYAFVLWDRSQAELRFARDFAGEKPLYWTSDVPACEESGGRGLVIGSTVPGVYMMSRHRYDLASPGWYRFSLDQWISHGFDPPLHGSLPQLDIEMLPPGLCWKAGLPDEEGGWPTIVHAPTRCAPLLFHDAKRDRTLSEHRLDHVLRQAVVSRAEADVPLGCFLSGGVDSSLLAWYLVQGCPNARAFTVRMPDEALDESIWAEQVAQLIGIEHTVLDCHARPTDDLLTLIPQLGLPFGDSSLLPSYWVCRAARGTMKVAMGGDGADELFGGYDRYRAARWLERHRSLFKLVPRRLLRRTRDKSWQTRSARLVAAARGNGYEDLLAIYPPDDLSQLLGFVERTEFEHIRDPLKADFHSYLPSDILRKTDTASMAVALEVRSPYLANEVVETALSAPLSELMPRGQRKGLLRAVARKYLPAEIVDRPKQGFAIPIGEWFRSDYGGMKQLLMDHLNSSEPWGPPSLGIDLNMKFVRQMLDEHMGTGPSGRIVRDHSQRLYMLLVLSIWAKWMGSLA